ncbi:MAG: hypothetical protein ACI4I5_08460 [Acutalibacteraceae bacterium]
MKRVKTCLCILLAVLTLSFCACQKKNDLPIQMMEETTSKVTAAPAQQVETVCVQTAMRDETVAAQTTAQHILEWKMAYMRFITENTEHIELTPGESDYYLYCAFEYGFCQLPGMESPFLVINDGNFYYFYLYENGEVVKKEEFWEAGSPDLQEDSSWMYVIDDKMYLGFAVPGVEGIGGVRSFGADFEYNGVARYQMNFPLPITGKLILRPEYYDAEGNTITQSEYEAIVQNIETEGTEVAFTHVNGLFRQATCPC